MDDKTKEQLFGQIRVILAAGGGWLAAKGYGNTELWTAIEGMIIIVAPALWSLYAHAQQEKKIQERENIAVNAGVALANTTPPEVGQTVRAVDVPQIIKDFGVKTDPQGEVTK